MKTLAILTAALWLSGCAALSEWAGRPRFDLKTREAVQAHVSGRRFLVLFYEGVKEKSGKRQSAFRFDKSALLDKVFIQLHYTVLERGTVQKIIEAEPLPESGSFPRETLAQLAAASGSDVLILGYAYSDDSVNLVGISSKRWKVILRAIDLHSSEVINSVQSDDDSDSGFRSLAGKLVYKPEVAQY